MAFHHFSSDIAAPFFSMRFRPLSLFMAKIVDDADEEADNEADNDDDDDNEEDDLKQERWT